MERLILLFKGDCAFWRQQGQRPVGGLGREADFEEAEGWASPSIDHCVTAANSKKVMVSRVDQGVPRMATVYFYLLRERVGLLLN
jgi:hypothetical protein